MFYIHGDTTTEVVSKVDTVEYLLSASSDVQHIPGTQRVHPYIILLRCRHSDIAKLAKMQATHDTAIASQRQPDSYQTRSIYLIICFFQMKQYECINRRARFGSFVFWNVGIYIYVFMPFSHPWRRSWWAWQTCWGTFVCRKKKHQRRRLDRANPTLDSGGGVSYYGDYGCQRS